MTTPRRERFWDTTLFNVQLGVTSTITPVDLLGNVDAAKTNRTVTRLLIDFTAYVDGMANSLDGGNLLDMGVAVYSLEAHTAGAHPDPAVASDFPAAGWLWRSRVVVLNQQSSGTQESYQYPHVQLDLRAQRMANRGTTLRLLGSSASSSGTGSTLRIAGIIRTLVLL